MTKKKSANIQEIILTKKAAEKVQEISEQEKKKDFGLKFYVLPGGCSGFQYGMDFEKKPAKNDLVMEQHGVKLFVDKESLELIKGTTIDFVESEQGSGFKIDNPNVQDSCGSCHGSC